ncbi:unnamed protein product [Mytilus edulis]|uniref:Uncharacterized protein n=1 Tax=Mytilus edulis TaxID=6550 RepID=A0A8S3V2N2_MYTED|nr:unnamed protein product [Mytilus edulis]
MKHWRLIFTEKLLTEQEKIIWTLQKDYEKLVERVKLKRKQSLRQTEYEKELMKMVKNLSGEERKNNDYLDKRFDEHWTLWSKKLIPGLLTSLPSLTDTIHQKTIKSVTQFEDRFALMSFSFISKNIESFQSEKFTLTPKFHALLLSHVAKYLITYFTRVHKKEEEKQRKFRKQQQELMYQFVSNVTVTNNAANYFLKALSDGMIEHVSTKIPGDIADLIVKEFGHSKHKMIKMILLDLAEKDQFRLFKMYIDEPRDYANAWTIQYVNTKLFAVKKGSTLTLYSTLAEKLLSQVARPLKTGIMIASSCCSKSLQNNNSWIDTFNQEMMKAKVFPLKPENIEFINSQVTDFETFSDALLYQFDSIINNIFCDFSKTTEKDIEWKECPYTKILDELWGCDEQCPFCSETCIHSNKNHLELGAKHRCWMHRPQGIGDVKSKERYYLIFKKDVLEVENCNFLIGTSRTYKNPDLLD